MTDQTASAPDSSSSLMAILAWILGIFTGFIGPPHYLPDVQRQDWSGRATDS